jgi:uncharacterized integral membrane protein (TIGR00698 family)
MTAQPADMVHEPSVDASAIATEARGDAAFGVWPGLALTAAIAAMAFALRQISFVSVLSPIILSIALGMTLRNLTGVPALAQPGITLSMRRILRFAIVLLGLQLTASQLVEVGATGIAIIALTLVATFLFTVQLGRLIGVDRKLAELIAAGTSICGASAVIATNTVTRAADEDVAYAVACVTVFGSIAMFVYPLLPGLLQLDPHAFGLWSGASIHEIAQVVAAAFQDGKAAGEFGTIAKLARVTMLAPVVISLGFLAARKARRDGDNSSTAGAPLPWFVLGFIAMVGINSLVAIPAEARSVIATLTTFLLAMALAAMGLETDIRKLCAKGVRPLALGAGAFLFISGFSLAMIKILM